MRIWRIVETRARLTHIAFLINGLDDLPALDCTAAPNGNAGRSGIGQVGVFLSCNERTICGPYVVTMLEVAR